MRQRRSGCGGVGMEGRRGRIRLVNYQIDIRIGCSFSPTRITDLSCTRLARTFISPMTTEINGYRLAEIHSMTRLSQFEILCVSIPLSLRARKFSGRQMEDLA